MDAERFLSSAAVSWGLGYFPDGRVVHPLYLALLCPVPTGIANFTDVAKTFTGIVRALREEVQILLEHSVSVWVRRGGPNFEEGLAKMVDVGKALGVPMHVYGPETHITAIVPLALGVDLAAAAAGGSGGDAASASSPRPASRSVTGSPRSGTAAMKQPSQGAPPPPPPPDCDSQIDHVLEVPGEQPTVR